MVLIAKGRVIAGLDLSALNEKNVIVKNDSVWLTLPSAKILDMITNPSDFEVFTEEGTWSSNEVNAVKQKAVGIMRAEAQKRGLIEQANERAKLLMGNFLKATGFVWVEVKIQVEVKVKVEGEVEIEVEVEVEVENTRIHEYMST